MSSTNQYLEFVLDLLGELDDVAHRKMMGEYVAVSMGGSNEFVECFCGGAVAEGGSGAVVEFVGDGVEVGLVAGDGGSFGKVSADESVGVSLVPLSQGLWG